MAPAPIHAQSAAPAVPFTVGEEMIYKASFGGLPAGTAKMRVDGIETVRDRQAYHLVFTIDGGIPGFRIHDRYDSWIDVMTLSSLRHRQEISEGRYSRTTVYEIFPEQAEYRKNDEPPQTSVSNPLDDGSFVYAVRMVPMRVGETNRLDRYFRPDRNPVTLVGLRTESVKVGAGTFDAIVVSPSIKANGLFSENGNAEIWFTDDERRLPVKIKSKFAKISLTFSMQKYTPGVVVAQTADTP